MSKRRVVAGVAASIMFGGYAASAVQADVQESKPGAAEVSIADLIGMPGISDAQRSLISDGFADAEDVKAAIGALANCLGNEYGSLSYETGEDGLNQITVKLAEGIDRDKYVEQMEKCRRAEYDVVSMMVGYQHRWAPGDSEVFNRVFAECEIASAKLSADERESTCGEKALNAIGR